MSDPPVLPVVARTEPLEALVRPPGSKSLTNRALVAAALATGGVSRLEGGLEADDTVVMREGLRAFGVMVDDADDPWLVLGAGGALEAPGEPIDVRASGTTARFLTAVAALAGGTTVIDGTARMRRRPIGPLADALVGAGVEVVTDGGYPPVRVRGGHLAGGPIEVDGSRSSQFASALLLIAPCASAPTEIAVTGLPVSTPYLRSTVEVMQAFGASVEVSGDHRFTVAPTGYRATTVEIEADASAAVYPLAACAILGGVVGIEGIPAGSTQPDLAFARVLEQMGCAVHHRGSRLALAGPSSRLEPVDVDMGDAPDAALALAVVCMFAGGRSRIRGLSTLRLKESDRLSALETELRRLGGEARVKGDDLVVGPGDLHGATVETYDDHRIAMSFAVAGLAVPGVEIADPGCVAKTWPGFFDMLAAL